MVAGSKALFTLCVTTLAATFGCEEETFPCIKALDRVGVALERYASAHDGEYPESLGALVRLKYLQQSDLVCKGTPIQFVAGSRNVSQLSKREIVAYVIADKGEGAFANALYASGATEPVRQDELPKTPSGRQ